MLKGQRVLLRPMTPEDIARQHEFKQDPDLYGIITRRRDQLMKTLADIKDHLGQQKSKLAALYTVKELGIFGSYVRGEQQPNSDLDILIDFDEYPSLLEFIGLEQTLSEQLELQVDLVMKSDLKPRLRQRILQEVVYL